MVDHLEALRRESARFGRLLRDADLARDVPSCPDWDLADLAWHLTEVQHFWAEIAGRLLTDPADVNEISRPEDVAELPTGFAARSTALLRAVTDRAPNAACWSWDPDGGTIAWVRRRQAHEALIHRIDAELALGVGHDPIEPALAADGVDEILRVMMAGVPPWGTFTADGTSVVLAAADSPDRWAARLGRFTGTSPNSGITYDDEAIDLVEEGLPDVTTTITASAADLDRWLWGRTDASALTIDGDSAIAEHVRKVAVLSTQ